jgi:hypothetical protein
MIEGTPFELEIIFCTDGISIMHTRFMLLYWNKARVLDQPFVFSTSNKFCETDDTPTVYLITVLKLAYCTFVENLCCL